ncbi:MAG: dihydroorotase [Cyclobacteriaceae bacterium]|nr:dihydroorotase [Cyclobacteriaceae bacterium]
MSETYLIKAGTLVNEGKVSHQDVLVRNECIEQVGESLEPKINYKEINAAGKHLFPGVIDDQVHFREPGLTQKGEIYTEAKAAVAGGVTSYMEMPNVQPQTLTQSLLEEKYEMGRKRSLANFSFYMGASNENLEEVMKTDPRQVCGVKVFMGSSTGDMLVDDTQTLERIFSRVSMLIATHCEDELTIRTNMAHALQKYGQDIPFEQHPIIRSAEACYLSSSRAVSLAKKYGTRLHVLHISTGKELELFENETALSSKKITAEACIHHLWFSDEDYQQKGALIKWNPAVKTSKDRAQIWDGLLADKIDVIATDHAPHTRQEKNQIYANAPSGGPLIQHSLVAMLEFYHQGKISLEQIAEKMSHAVAVCYKVQQRGFIREGYFADLVLVDLNRPWRVGPDNIVAKCGWSPFERALFRSQVEKTFVSGHLAYDTGQFDEKIKGKRLSFNP